MSDELSNYTTWDEEFQNLGKESDRAIAKRMGLSRERVRQIRDEYQIPPAVIPVRTFTEEQIAKITKRLQSKPPIDHLATTPITWEQLKQLIERRIEFGWSQADLARHIQVSTVTINKFEWGAPINPGIFINLCYMLDFEPEIEVVVRIRSIDNNNDEGES